MSQIVFKFSVYFRRRGFLEPVTSLGEVILTSRNILDQDLYHLFEEIVKIQSYFFGGLLPYTFGGLSKVAMATLFFARIVSEPPPIGLHDHHNLKKAHYLWYIKQYWGSVTFWCGSGSADLYL
jgi:hypothetical protein